MPPRGARKSVKCLARNKAGRNQTHKKKYKSDAKWVENERNRARIRMAKGKHSPSRENKDVPSPMNSTAHYDKLNKQRHRQNSRKRKAEQFEDTHRRSLARKCPANRNRDRITNAKAMTKMRSNHNRRQRENERHAKSRKHVPGYSCTFN